MAPKFSAMWRRAYNVSSQTVIRGPKMIREEYGGGPGIFTNMRWFYQ